MSPELVILKPWLEIIVPLDSNLVNESLDAVWYFLLKVAILELMYLSVYLSF